MLLIEIIITLGFFISLPFYFIERVIHKKSYGWKEKFGNVKNSVISKDDKVIHIHGCSVGEILALEALLHSVRSVYPEYKVVLTTFTHTGQLTAQKKYSDLVDYITYFPFDIPMATNKFLDTINPNISIIAETEIWPYFAYSCKKRNIPLYIINARISDTSYSSYKLFKLFFKKVFENYSGVLAQSKEDKEKFVTIGLPVNKVKLMGNLKFDINKTDNFVDVGQEGYRVFVAGSTHSIENKIVIAAYKKLKENFDDLKFIIAPRHLERVNDIKNLLEKENLSYGMRSEQTKFSKDIDVLILDTYGELKNTYSICDIAFIGGSFTKTGGHNPLEASIFEKPVLTGSNIFNFKDVYNILSKSGACKIVKTERELFDALNELLENSQAYDNMKKASKDVFETQRGAVKFALDEIIANK